MPWEAIAENQALRLPEWVILDRGKPVASPATSAVL